MAHNYVIKFGLLLNFILDIFCALEEGLVRSTCIAVQSKIVESALCNAHCVQNQKVFFIKLSAILASFGGTILMVYVNIFPHEMSRAVNHP